jgi:hypothetical protein
MVANEKFNNFYNTYSWYRIEITSLGKKNGNSPEQATKRSQPDSYKDCACQLREDTLITHVPRHNATKTSGQNFLGGTRHHHGH